MRPYPRGPVDGAEPVGGGALRAQPGASRTRAGGTPSSGSPSTGPWARER